MTKAEVWKCRHCGGEKILEGVRGDSLGYWRFRNHRKGCAHIWERIE